MTQRFPLALASLLLCALIGAAIPAEAALFKKGPSPDEQRAEIRQMREEALAQLYREKPSTRDEISRAAGYAVFSNVGVNVLLVSTGNGKGVARDNASSRDTFMNMFSAGGGFGMGVKTFRAVFVFHTREAFVNFVEKGWDLSAQADAAATTDADTGAQAGAMDEALTVTQGTSIYQLTDKGLALQATLQGTKYWKDEDLN